MIEIKSDKRILSKLIYCDPTEEQLDNFILAILQSFSILDSKRNEKSSRSNQALDR